MPTSPNPTINPIQLPPGQVNPRALALMAAIYHVEGTFSLTSLGHKQNNPGDLRSWGTVPQVNG